MMKHNHTYRLWGILWICSTMLWLAGCRQDREDRGWQNQNFVLDEELARDSRDSVDFILRKSMGYNTQFSTFAANLDITLLIGEEPLKIGLGGQIRVQKDRIIWASCTKFLELGRIRITPDSLLLYNKFGNEGNLYLDDSVPMLPTLFKLMQCLFMRQTDSVMLLGERTLAYSDSLQWGIEGVMSDSIAWQLFSDKRKFRPNALHLQVVQKGMAIQMKLIYFEENGFELSVALNQKSLVNAQIRYNKIRWNNELSFPLSIPKSAKMEINHGLTRNMEQGNLF